jgi:hypothetical protein
MKRMPRNGSPVSAGTATPSAASALSASVDGRMRGVGQFHSETMPARGDGSREARRPASDHQDIGIELPHHSLQ